MSKHPAQSSTSFQVRVHPNSRTTDIHCTILGGGPCGPCNEFQDLQSSIIQATQENRGTTNAQNMRDLTLRHEINIQHDPINVFPFKIKSIIFELYCEPREGSVTPQVKLLSVCKQWREVAISIPILWTIFSVPLISQNEFSVKQFKLWLQCSKLLPVFLSYKCLTPSERYQENRNYEMLDGSTSTFTDLVIANKDRIYGLKRTALPEVVLGKFFVVEWCSVSIWPILSHITIDLLSINEALDVLQCCPQATFVEFRHVLGTNSMMQPFIDCPHLQLLKVEFGRNSDPGDLYNCLLTPTLEDLTCHSDAVINPIPSLQALLH